MSRDALSDVGAPRSCSGFRSACWRPEGSARPIPRREVSTGRAACLQRGCVAAARPPARTARRLCGQWRGDDHACRAELSGRLPVRAGRRPVRGRRDLRRLSAAVWRRSRLRRSPRAFVPVALGVHVAGGYDGDGLAPGLLFWAVTSPPHGSPVIAPGCGASASANWRNAPPAVEREAEHERRLAAAQERTRIARELHDSAGHAINVILIQAGAARLLRERDAGGIAARDHDHRGRRPRAPSARSIGSSTHCATRTTFRRPQIRPRWTKCCTSTGSADWTSTPVRGGTRRVLSRNVAWAAYRIVQEALTNAARHGAGTPTSGCASTRRCRDQRHQRDCTGRSVRRAGGHGIVGMRERALLLGGTLQTSAEDGRFRVLARLPYDEPAS